MTMSRRDFLAISAVGMSSGIAVATGGIALAQPARPDQPSRSQDDAATPPGPPPPTTRKGDMLYRTLGRTGETVSIIGVGGAHIGRTSGEDESIKIIRTAVDNGVNFMDNSWDYNDGVSEKRMGKGLKDGYRNKVFLMTKIDGRDKESATKQLDESLRRLQTDRIDLLQFHEILRMEDPDRIFAQGGALEAVLDARKAGKVRYIGFTGHKDPLVHLRMLEVASKNGFRFDTVQMPLNVMDAHFRSFQHLVLPLLLRENIGVLGMKPMGSGVILKSNAVQPVECLHYAMSLPTTVVITGIDSMDILNQDLQAVKTFSPMPHDQMSALVSRTRQAAEDGRYELFKTTSHFDTTAKHPEWLGREQ